MAMSPRSASDYRLHVRAIADACLLDTFITYIALLRERGLVDHREMALDEWSGALLEAGAHARSALDTVRVGGDPESLIHALASTTGIDVESIDDRAEALIRERQQSIRHGQSRFEVVDDEPEPDDDDVERARD